MTVLVVPHPHIISRVLDIYIVTAERASRAIELGYRVSVFFFMKIDNIVFNQDQYTLVHMTCGQYFKRFCVNLFKFFHTGFRAGKIVFHCFSGQFQVTS